MHRWAGSSPTPWLHAAPLCCSVDHLPLLNKLFELLGLGVSAWFAYR